MNGASVKTAAFERKLKAGGKFEDSEIGAELARATEAALKAYRGRNGFLKSLQYDMGTGKLLTGKQIRGALNVMLAIERRRCADCDCRLPDGYEGSRCLLCKNEGAVGREELLRRLSLRREKRAEPVRRERGRCRVCRRKLRDSESIACGIGPSCAKRVAAA